MSTTYGSYGLRIDGKELDGKDAIRDYEFSVKWVLDWILRSDTGTAVLGAIKRAGQPLLILPYTKDAEKVAGTCNAYAAPVDMVKAGAKDQPILNGRKVLTENNPLKRLLKLPQEPLAGTGEGSDSFIRFSPGMWGFGGACYPGMPGASPSEILLHEMLHAYRQMRGDSYALPTTGGRVQYDNLEEFFAIVVTNIFVSDPTSPTPNRTLRADHWGFQPLAAAQSTSKGFLAQKANQNLIGKIVADEAGLALDLKEIKATFNPVREYINPS